MVINHVYNKLSQLAPPTFITVPQSSESRKQHFR